MNNLFERRKERRFNVKGGALVNLQNPSIFRFGRSKQTELGPVVNISMGGLASLYVNKKNKPITANMLSITMPKENIKIDDISFSIVSDYKTISLPENETIRKCSIKFDNLSDNQINSLKDFIKNHTQ
jgi:esterase/lipase